MTKKIISVVLALVMAASLICFAGCSQDEGGVPLTGEVINVYNWGEYISNGDDDSLDVIKEFTKRTGIEVIYTTYPSNEEMYAKLTSGAADYDVIIPSDYMIEQLIAEDRLEALNYDNIPNAEYIMENFLGLEYDPEDIYSVPYTWGTTGIIYNKTMVDEADIAAQSWDILWDEDYSGEILMIDNPRDAFGIALIKLGYSLNTTDPDEWNEAYELLSEQYPLLQAYVMDRVFDKMLNAEAAIAPYYAGDAQTILEENSDIGFYIPKEGSNYFVDAMCVVKGTEHKEAAEQFINFMLDPEIALANIEYINYSTPNQGAFELLDEETKMNENLYPPQKILSECETFIYLPEDIRVLENELWIKVKTQ